MNGNFPYSKIFHMTSKKKHPVVITGVQKTIFNKWLWQCQNWHSWLGLGHSQNIFQNKNVAAHMCAVCGRFLDPVTPQVVQGQPAIPGFLPTFRPGPGIPGRALVLLLLTPVIRVPLSLGNGIRGLIPGPGFFLQWDTGIDTWSRFFSATGYGIS